MAARPSGGPFNPNVTTKASRAAGRCFTLRFSRPFCRGALLSESRQGHLSVAAITGGRTKEKTVPPVLLSPISSLNLVLLQFAIQRGLADSQQPRRQQFVAVELRNCIQNRLSLEF